MSRIIFFTVVLGIYLVIDTYSFNGLKVVFNNPKTYAVIYWIISALFVVGILSSFIYLQTHQGIRPLWLNLVIGSIFIIFITKLLFGGMLFIYDISRYFIGLIQWISDMFSIVEIKDGFIPKRRKLVTGLIGGITVFPFLGMLYGITKGKYRYEVNKLTLHFKDLPKAFDGFKIVQISDIHSGSYDSYEQVMKGIHMVNELDPDLLVFTGDLVNSDKDEIDPYISAFEKLKSKNGKFSITGNHDYYGNRGQDVVGKELYWTDFLNKHKLMGFDILNNENRVIRKGNDAIRLVGVENWGLGPFPKHGDLDKALIDVSNDEFTVLLSHDPTHWDVFTKKHKNHIHLTLSGHTHGMQFGINALGIKWSPIKYRYKKWAGLYTENDRHLFINKGFGFLGLPGRLGMWPEITEIELKIG